MGGLPPQASVYSPVTWMNFGVASPAQSHPESRKAWIQTWTGLIPENLSLSHQVGQTLEGQEQSRVTQPWRSNEAKLGPPACHVPACLSHAVKLLFILLNLSSNAPFSLT